MNKSKKTNPMLNNSDLEEILNKVEQLECYIHTAHIYVISELIDMIKKLDK